MCNGWQEGCWDGWIIVRKKGRQEVNEKASLGSSDRKEAYQGGWGGMDNLAVGVDLPD